MEINVEIMYERCCEMASNFEKIDEHIQILNNSLLELQITAEINAIKSNKDMNDETLAKMRGHLGFVEDLVSRIGCQIFPLKEELHMQVFGISSSERLKQIIISSHRNNSE